MTALGPFADGFASWRRILGAVQEPEQQRQVFENAILEVASYVARGLDRSAAADELADMAASIGFDDVDEVQAQIGAAFAKVNGPERVPDDWSGYSGNGHTAPAAHYARRYQMLEQALIPKRAWLYGGHYIRQTVSATVAPGGWGKTTLQLYEAIEMVAAGLKVWYLSGEDPLVELDRRIAAHCSLHRLVLDDCPGQLFVDDKASFPLSIAKMSRRRELELQDADLLLFEAAIAHDAIDVVILDPFVGFHGVPENDNNAVDVVVKALVAIAGRVNCAIEISHHVRKGQGAGLRSEVTVDDARGGSAIIAAVRSARVLNRMSSAEAELAKVDANKKNFYVRVDIGKRNMAPPPEKATWYRLQSIELDNGDQVQALRLWEFPTVFDGVATVDTEYVREMVRVKDYRADSRSDEWLGIIVAKRLHLDVTNKSDIIKIQRLIGVWLRNGLFVKKEMRDEQRRLRMFYVAPTLPDNVVPSRRDEDDDRDE
jgi:AAA domain